MKLEQIDDATFWVCEKNENAPRPQRICIPVPNSINVDERCPTELFGSLTTQTAQFYYLVQEINKNLKYNCDQLGYELQEFYIQLSELCSRAGETFYNIDVTLEDGIMTPHLTKSTKIPTRTIASI